MLQGVIEVLTSYQNFFHSFRINFEIVFKLIKPKQKKLKYSLLSLNGHLYKTDTLVKRTLRVGPCLSLLPLFGSLQDGHLSKTDTYCRSPRCPSQKELTLLCWLWHRSLNFFFTLSGPKVYVDIWGLKSQKGRSWNIKTESTRKLSNFDF